MSFEEHKALVQRFVEEFWNQGNMAAADELNDSHAANLPPWKRGSQQGELQSVRYDLARRVSRLAF